MKQLFMEAVLSFLFPDQCEQWSSKALRFNVSGALMALADDTLMIKSACHRKEVVLNSCLGGRSGSSLCMLLACTALVSV